MSGAAPERQSAATRTSADAGDDAPTHALWWLPLLAGLLPLIGTVVAFRLSVRLGLIEGCNPFIDGCVSISRAARQGLPNHLFRALLLPAAVLQALCWMLCGPWLRSLQALFGRGWQRALPWLGVGAALFLVLYGTFLGTEGEGYRWMRRYGVVFYFGGTCIGMLIVAGAMQRRIGAGALERRVTRLLLVPCAALPLLGLVHVLVPLLQPSALARDALQNVTEWWGAAIFTLFFFVLAWAWAATGFRAALSSRAAS